MATPLILTTGVVYVRSIGTLSSDISFASSSGLSFATSVGPITIKGGDSGAGDPALIISDPTDDYFILRFPDGYTALQFDAYSDIVAPLGLGIAGLLTFGLPTAESPINAYKLWTGNHTEFVTLQVGFDSGGFDAAGQAGYAIGTNPVASGNSIIGHISDHYMHPQVNDTAVVTDVYGQWFAPAAKAAGATITNSYAFYSDNLAGYGTNPYYFWADSRGVFRIREDNVADGSGNPQAIPTLYNPRFTKYVAGAANYERTVEEWIANVAYLGNEAGGTGTLRKTVLLGAGVGFESTVGTSTYLEGFEISAPTAPASNGGRIFFQDSGAGKTQAAVRFASGAVQVFATEP